MHYISNHSRTNLCNFFRYCSSLNDIDQRLVKLLLEFKPYPKIIAWKNIDKTCLQHDFKECQKKIIFEKLYEGQISSIEKRMKELYLSKIINHLTKEEMKLIYDSYSPMLEKFKDFSKKIAENEIEHLKEGPSILNDMKYKRLENKATDLQYELAASLSSQKRMLTEEFVKTEEKELTSIINELENENYLIVEKEIVNIFKKE